MRSIGSVLALGFIAVAIAGTAHQGSDGPYHVAKVTKVGGDGGFDYVYADPAGRMLYIARSGRGTSRMTVFNLDGLAAGEDIPETGGHGAVVDPRSHHGFSSSNPIVMWDTKTMKTIKTIEAQGNPDGILGDPASQKVFILSHREPNVTVIDAKDGSVVGTINVGGAPEESAVDGKGLMYVDLEDKDAVAVVDTKAMKVINTYSLNGKGGGDAGLAFDVKNHVLFVACREPAVMVMLDANTGKYLADLPIGNGCDGAVFNPRTGECFSSQGDGTLTIIKETTPTSFVIEQTVKTMPGAKTLTLDNKTGKIFLIAAEYGAPAAPAGGAPTNGRQRRGPMVPGSFSVIEVSK